ncbi:Fic family protein [Mycoplasma bradburyae]|uniref:Fic family protein n=1 Tax=Mycoplasma bradburyae TaxID=2963128 RepID=A0ABT5GBB1_9MOLU|nr:Fic family protein [Mycoplasma bradburyae]MDC4182002.1 Fic family protein [Mycoplasma bradburyae]UTS70427.1 Fic family protein [Mycoplasma bradburyae]
MNFKKETLDQIILELAYSSCSMENNTFTYDEVRDLFASNKPPTGQKNNQEFYELVNFKMGIEYIVKFYDQLDINIDTILKLHSIIMRFILDDNGAFRKHNLKIKSAKHIGSEHSKIVSKLEQLNSNFKNEIVEVLSEKDRTELILKYHCIFHKIHPFSDGNGRVARAIMFLMQLKYKTKLYSVNPDIKNDYFNGINKYLLTGNIDDLYNLIKDNLINID